MMELYQSLNLKLSRWIMPQINTAFQLPESIKKDTLSFRQKVKDFLLEETNLVYSPKPIGDIVKCCDPVIYNLL